MSEEAEMWAVHKEQGREKRWANKESSLKLLRDRGISYVELSSSHYRIGDFDFWPTTGKYVYRPTQEYGRGVKNLLRLLS